VLKKKEAKKRPEILTLIMLLQLSEYLYRYMDVCKIGGKKHCLIVTEFVKCLSVFEISLLIVEYTR
jgi:hypothetical protein